MWIIGGVLSFYLLQKLAALLAIGLFLLAVWMKSKISHMDGEKWDQYFRTLSNRGYTAVFFVFYTGPPFGPGLGGIPALFLFLFSRSGCAGPAHSPAGDSKGGSDAGRKQGKAVGQDP